MTRRHDSPLSPTLATAWTKADYDKYVEETGKRPSDTSRNSRGASRGQITQLKERHDIEVRPTPRKYTAEERRKNSAARRARDAANPNERNRKR